MCHHIAPTQCKRSGLLLGSAFVLLVAAGYAQRPAAAKETPHTQAGSSVEELSPSRLLVKLWTLPGAFDEVRHVTLRRDTLYIAGTPRGIEAINTRDGTRRWRHDGLYVVNQRPTEFENTVFLVEGGQFVTLFKETGRELTRSRTRIGTLTPLFPGKDAWAIGATDNRVYGVFPDSGRRYWHITLEGHITHITPGGRDLLYVQTSKGRLYAVSIMRRSLMWHHRFPRPQCSPALIAGNTLLVGCEDYYFYSLSTADGSLRSKLCLRAPVLGRPVATKSHVFVATTDGVLHALDRRRNDEAWSIPNAERVLTTTPRHVIFLRREESKNVIGIAETATGKVLSQAAAPRYRFFAGAPETGVFYAVGANGDVIAVADRERTTPAGAAVRRQATVPTGLGPVGSGEQAVKAAVRRIFRAGTEGNVKAFTAGITPESVRFLESLTAMMGAENARQKVLLRADNLEVGKIRITGEEARAETKATIAGKVQQKPIFLRRVGGVWKVDLMKAVQ